MSIDECDFVVIGAGPGGYSAAFRAADLGRSVTLIDPRPTLGGVCLNEGCIPSKALLHAAEAYRTAMHLGEWGINLGKPKIDLAAMRSKKDSIVGNLTGGLKQLAKKRNVTVLLGTATFKDASHLSIESAGGKRIIHFQTAVVAIGSRPIALPGWPQDDPRIMDSTGALALTEIPKKLAIIGGGIIGLEMATVYSAFGSDVTIIEMSDQIAAGADAKCTRILHKAMQDHGCTIYCETRVDTITTTAKAISLTCSGTFDGTMKVDAVIQAVGRRPNGDLLAVENANLQVTAQGAISVDRQCKTGVSNIFAVGDVTGAPMLAHRATHQGKIAAENACGHKAFFDTDVIPAVAYTDPEMAWAGVLPHLAKERNINHQVSEFPWAASGRNLASGAKPGLTRLVWNKDTKRVIGASIIGAHAGELLSELVLAIEMGATVDDLALTIHAHPTLSETTAFAAELAMGNCTDF